MAIRCIAFDLDDTLWDCQAVIGRAEQQLYDWLQASHPQITTAYSPAELVQHRVAYVQRRPDLHHDLGLLRRQWLQVLADEHAADPALVEPAFQHFLKARNQVELFPNVLEQLQLLAENYQLGVITNGNANVHQIGIGHFFSFTHSSAEAGVAKPHPLIFQQALEKAGVSASETVYVGDDPEKDIIGAKRAGLGTIWYNPTRREAPPEVMPDAVMTNFAEITRLVELL